MADNPQDRLEEETPEFNPAEMDQTIELNDIVAEPTDIELDAISVEKTALDLDDLAVGAADEDEDEEEEIIELTEEVAGPDAGVDAGAGGAGEEAEALDLSGLEQSRGGQSDEAADEALFVDSDEDLDDEWLTEEAGADPLDDLDDLDDLEAAAAEEEIDKELNDYFDLQETDEFVSLGKEAGFEASEPAITPEMLDAALERVLSKMYGEKIEQLIADTVEKKLAEKTESLK